MPNLLVSPDKFRSSATAHEIAGAAARGAARAGWTADLAPMSDGGEGFCDVLGGKVRLATVAGPAGRSVTASWRLSDRRSPTAGVQAVTAYVEAASAAGLDLAGGPEANDPLGATTFGVGELVVAAVAAGATRVVVGCGGTASTDGGEGALDALSGAGRLRDLVPGIELVAAYDVAVDFGGAIDFAAQKGASAAQAAVLTERLQRLADRYRRHFGLDVAGLAGAGAAGGLAGGLAAIGARLVPGADFVAEAIDLDCRADKSGLVMTGEGRLDRHSLAGKVVGTVARRCQGRAGLLCVVGDVASPSDSRLGDRATVVSLVDRFGAARAFGEVLELVEEVVYDSLGSRFAGQRS